MTREQLKTSLTEKNIKFNKSDTKKVLTSLLREIELKDPKITITENPRKDYTNIINKKGLWTLINGEGFTDAGMAAIRNYEIRNMEIE